MRLPLWLMVFDIPPTCASNSTTSGGGSPRFQELVGSSQAGGPGTDDEVDAVTAPGLAEILVLTRHGSIGR